MEMSQAQAPKHEASGPAEAYAALIAAGDAMPDAAQAQVLAHLQQLHEALLGWKPGAKAGLFSARRKPAPKSLYIWGSVGRGKSMLMDLFFTHAPLPRKRRVHFHAFMQEVHARIHQIRQEKSKSGADPVMVLAAELARDTHLLCFDELQATDVADASLIFRLFEALLAADVVMVATSNRPPESLYTGGVQAERFARLTALIQEKMEVVTLTSPTDWRRAQRASLSQVYFSPLGADAERFAARMKAELAPNAAAERFTLHVHGRELHLKRYGELVAASFDELCSAALGPADYLALAQGTDMLLLTGIPLLGPENRNEAKRFVTLIDALYEAGTLLICTASAPPDQLYPEGDGSFEFQRTASRLIEMGSARYVERLREG